MKEENRKEENKFRSAIWICSPMCAQRGHTQEGLWELSRMHPRSPRCKEESTGDFSGDASGKEPACQCRRCKRRGLIPGSGRSPVEGNGNPLQHSCLENPMYRGARWATVHRAAKSRIPLKQLSMQHAGQIYNIFSHWLF